MATVPPAAFHGEYSIPDEGWLRAAIREHGAARRSSRTQRDAILETHSPFRKNTGTGMFVPSGSLIKPQCVTGTRENAQVQKEQKRPTSSLNRLSISLLDRAYPFARCCRRLSRHGDEPLASHERADSLVYHGLKE